MAGFYIRPADGLYYEGAKAAADDVEVPKRPAPLMRWCPRAKGPDGGRGAWRHTPASRNAPIKERIAALEASVTPRRLREAHLSLDGEVWLAEIDTKIVALRATLKPEPGNDAS